MNKEHQIVVINPGSTSTKVAIYSNSEKLFYINIEHTAEELAKYPEIPDQLPFRRQTIIEELKKAGINVEKSSAVSAICTGLPPMLGGIYEVNDKMVEHARLGLGSRHPGNLGPILAKDMADKIGVKAYIVDPSSTDEFRIEARLTGMRGVLRTSRGHPLNQRAVAMQYANDIGKKYEDLNLVVVHMGGGISVSAHEKGKMVDTVDSTRGEGRMAPTRSGAIPAATVVEMCFSGQYSKKELLDKIVKDLQNDGMMSEGSYMHAGMTSNGVAASRTTDLGNKFLKFILDE